MGSNSENLSRTPVLLLLRNLCFALYFLLLFGERLAGGILGIFRGGEESMLYSDTFIPKLVHPLALLALLCGIVVMRKQWKPLFLSVTGRNASVDSGALAAGIGCFLLSGMVHTGFLILAIQFTAYGLLAVGLIFHGIYFSNGLSGKERALATAYILCFSMTVPVIYDTALPGARGVAFIIVEIITNFYLIYAFASMTAVFLRTGRCSFQPLALLLMLILVGATFVLRLPESANWLIAAFAVLSLIVWLCTLFLNRPNIRLTADPFDFQPKQTL